MFRSISQEVFNLWIWIWGPGSTKSCWKRRIFSSTEIISSFWCFYDRSMKSCLTKSSVISFRFIFWCFYNRTPWSDTELCYKLFWAENFRIGDTLNPDSLMWLSTGKTFNVLFNLLLLYITFPTLCNREYVWLHNTDDATSIGLISN